MASRKKITLECLRSSASFRKSKIQSRVTLLRKRKKIIIKVPENVCPTWKEKLEKKFPDGKIEVTTSVVRWARKEDVLEEGLQLLFPNIDIESICNDVRDPFDPQVCLCDKIRNFLAQELVSGRS